MKYKGKATEILEAYASSYSQMDVESLALVLEYIEKRTAKAILEKIKEIKTQDCGYTDWLEDTYFGDEYQKLAKQYGVEVAE